MLTPKRIQQCHYLWYFISLIVIVICSLKIPSIGKWNSLSETITTFNTNFLIFAILLDELVNFYIAIMILKMIKKYYSHLSNQLATTSSVFSTVDDTAQPPLVGISSPTSLIPPPVGVPSIHAQPITPFGNHHIPLDSITNDNPLNRSPTKKSFDRQSERNSVKEDEKKSLRRNYIMLATLVACILWDWVSYGLMYYYLQNVFNFDVGLGTVIRNMVPLHFYFVWAFYYQVRTLRAG